MSGYVYGASGASAWSADATTADIRARAARNRELRAQLAEENRRLALLLAQAERKRHKYAHGAYKPLPETAAAVEALRIPDDPDWRRHRRELLAALA